MCSQPGLVVEVRSKVANFAPGTCVWTLSCSLLTEKPLQVELAGPGLARTESSQKSATKFERGLSTLT